MAEKILTITVPCYNSQDYMEHSIQSLLPGGNDVEIIIVDDGSKDRTGEIADNLAKQYPDIVRVIHQENGGHGEAVNTGMRNATGHFFKVVDSDDSLSLKAYRRVLKFLKEVREEEKELDMLVCNYMYDKQGVTHKKEIHYRNSLPINQFITWDDAGNFKPGHYILMHSVIYRTGLLRECGLELPKHTFYVDNLYVYEPLPYVKSLYYMDVCLYKYFIGRDDQSVNQKVMTSRVLQQLKVNEIMFRVYDLEAIEHEKLRNYMYSYLQIMCVITTAYLALDGTSEKWQIKKDFWKNMKQDNRPMYKHIMYKNMLGVLINVPGHVGKNIIKVGYRAANKIFGFN